MEGLEKATSEKGRCGDRKINREYRLQRIQITERRKVNLKKTVVKRWRKEQQLKNRETENGGDLHKNEGKKTKKKVEGGTYNIHQKAKNVKYVTTNLASNKMRGKNTNNRRRRQNHQQNHSSAACVCYETFKILLINVKEMNKCMNE